MWYFTIQEITQIVLFHLSKHPPVPTCLHKWLHTVMYSIYFYCNQTQYTDNLTIDFWIRKHVLFLPGAYKTLHAPLHSIHNSQTPPLLSLKSMIFLQNNLWDCNYSFNEINQWNLLSFPKKRACLHMYRLSTFCGAAKTLVKYTPLHNQSYLKKDNADYTLWDFWGRFWQQIPFFQSYLYARFTSTWKWLHMLITGLWPYLSTIFSPGHQWILRGHRPGYAWV